MLGNKGEQIIDDRIWVAKSHSPLGFGTEEKEWRSAKAIVVVRNPIDVIPSLSGVFLGQTHSQIPD